MSILQSNLSIAHTQWLQTVIIAIKNESASQKSDLPIIFFFIKWVVQGKISLSFIERLYYKWLILMRFINVNIFYSCLDN